MFEWNGKKYTTELAKPKKNSAPARSVVKLPPTPDLPEKDVKLAQAAMGGKPITTPKLQPTKPVTAGIDDPMFAAPEGMIVTPTQFKK